MYLATIIDLYSRHIFTWQIDKRKTTAIVSKKDYNLPQQPKGLCFTVTEVHSNRGSQ